MTEAELVNRFNYHKPDEKKVQGHDAVRASLLWVANMLNETVPEGREKSLAMTKLEEAMFWANAGIARSGEVSA